MSTRYVVIMAGGSGTRFWPASRSAYPKQFLSIGGRASLLRQTADRVATLVDRRHIFVVTAEVHADHARSDLSDLPPENILVEPEGRNTAPCIGWATRLIQARDPDARIAVLPADHWIADVPSFASHLGAAFEAARDRIVLFGIVPTQPETGYGYMRRGAKIADADGREVCAVERFVEKPNRETALEYMADGHYLWNSGMFVFPARVMAAELARLLPELDRGLAELERRPEALATIYPTLPSISIDYGVMEKSDQISVMPASFGWSDVGSWDAAMEIQGGDELGNVALGSAMLMDASRSMVDARAGRTVVLVGVDDVIVVDTPDAVLVIKRGESQRVKQVVEALRAHDRKDLL